MAKPSSAQNPASAESYLAQGNALYFKGQYAKAIEDYERSIRLSSASYEPWVNGAAILEEIGETKKAVEWYERAVALSTSSDVHSALGWAQWRDGDLQNAATTFKLVLGLEPNHAYSLLGLSRVELSLFHPQDALQLLDKAAKASPRLNLIAYYRGLAYDLEGDMSQAEEAYREAVIADSYFMEGRETLAKTYFKKRKYRDAWRQLWKILGSEPRHKRAKALLRKVQLLLSRMPPESSPPQPQPAPYLAQSDMRGEKIPVLRIGIGTNDRGKPRRRQSLIFKVTSDFILADAATGKKLVGGEAGKYWRARLKTIKKRFYITIHDNSGKIVLQRREALLIRPKSKSEGVIAVDEVYYPQAGPSTLSASKILRGDLEIAIFKSNMRLVNILDLENYTHGVLAAEMPIQSPIEALKAQAIVARSHALFIKQISQRHRHEGYDLCDEQHCQVYAGIRAESPLSRKIVDQTRGRIVTFERQLAHVLYSSNCGGFTQSGRDLAGWGDIPYWSSIADGKTLGERPDSPWKLRAWLMSWPDAYCRPSKFIHPSHFRWTRIIPFKDLEEKINRKFAIGKLLGLKILQRSPSGNVNALLIRGTKRKVKIDSEMRLRGLLGVGSLRSTLFVIDTEYGRDHTPQTLVFHGGGWGHGVGLCQSGAMGRAEAGQNYEEIIKAYFKGAQLGQLEYANE